MLANRRRATLLLSALHGCGMLAAVKRLMFINLFSLPLHPSPKEKEKQKSSPAAVIASA